MLEASCENNCRRKPLTSPFYHPKTRCAASTNPSVNAAITTSPIAPTANGFSPCFDSALKFVRKPTPANVSKNAQRERLASAPICSLEKNAAVARAEIRRNPSTNLGNFCQRNLALLPTACAWPLLAQWNAYARTTNPISALRVVLVSTASFPAASEYSAPAAAA